MNYYEVTSIDFDFDYEDLTDDEKQEIVESVTSCLWTPESEDELVDCITDNTGWCIKSIEYNIIPA